MLEAYRVGTSLVLENGIGQQLTEIIRQFEQLDRIIRNTNAAARDLASIIKGMATIGATMGGTATAAEKMSAAATGVARAMPDVTRQAEATANAMERAASASARMFALPAADYARTEFPAGSVYQPSPIPGVYSIPVGGGLLGRGLTGFGGATIEAKSDYGHQATMLRAMGWSDSDLARAGTAAMKAQRGIFTITHNMKEPMQLAPALLRASVVLSEVDKGGELRQLFQSLQAGELRGVISAEQLPNFIRLIETAAVTTGSRAGPAEILQFLRSSGISGRILANPDLFGQFHPEIMSTGASRAGSGLQAFFQNFGAGRMSDAAVKTFLEQMGLAKEGSKFVKAGIGQWMAVSGGLKGEELVYGGNEAQFMREVLLPAIDEYNKSHFGYTNALLEARTGAALSNRIAGGRFLGEYFTELPLSDKYSGAMREGSTRDAYQVFAQNDPTLKARGLQATWTGFLTPLSSGPIMDAAMKALQGLTGGLNALGKVADEHKLLGSILVGIAEGLGALALAAAGLNAALWLAGPIVRTAKYAGSVATGEAMGAGATTGLPGGAAAFLKGALGRAPRHRRTGRSWTSWRRIHSRTVRARRGISEISAGHISRCPVALVRQPGIGRAGRGRGGQRPRWPGAGLCDQRQRPWQWRDVSYRRQGRSPAELADRRRPE